jgi:hypothetical protein
MAYAPGPNYSRDQRDRNANKDRTRRAQRHVDTFHAVNQQKFCRAKCLANTPGENSEH